MGLVGRNPALVSSARSSSSRSCVGSLEGSEVRGGEVRLADLVDDQRADVETDVGEIAQSVEALLDGHLLEQRHHVDEGPFVAQHPGDGVGLGLDRAHLGDVGDTGIDVEEAHGPACGRRIEDDGVVVQPAGLAAPATALGPPGCFVDLADEQDVTHTRRDRRGEVDGADLLEGRAGATEFVEHLEVLEQGSLRVHRQPPQLAAALVRDEADLLGAQRWDVEGLREPLATLDLGDQDALAGAREGQGQG